jgi:hypothetical protein
MSGDPTFDDDQARRMPLPLVPLYRRAQCPDERTASRQGPGDRLDATQAVASDDCWFAALSWFNTRLTSLGFQGQRCESDAPRD